MFYYYLTNIITCNNINRVKAGITSHPATRIKPYQTLVNNIKYSYVLGVSCTGKQMLELETNVLYNFKNRRLWLQKIFCAYVYISVCKGMEL